MLQSRLLSLLALLSLSAACGRDETPKDGPGQRLAITVSPLTLDAIGDARFTLRAYSANGLVWEAADLLTSQYGFAGAGLAYVGTCDASANPHRVELVLQALYDTNGDVIPTDTWVNPAPAEHPLIRDNVICAENADTQVSFDLVIVRDARQGFFDMMVEFEDVFCSAKLDCLGDDDLPMRLLFDPVTGVRRETVVLGFACTAGPGASGPETTWLHMTDLVLECGPGPTTYLVSPAAGLGNVGGAPPVLFETAIYQIDEQLPGLDKCAWNLALGVNEGPAAANCRLRASGTASSAPFIGGMTPPNTIYPYVHYDLALTDGEGQVACKRHPLSAPPSEVDIAYTGFDGEYFAHSWQCGTTPTTSRVECAGVFPGPIAGESHTATFTPSPDGVTVAFGNSVSQLYDLPGSYELRGCCANPCCDGGADGGGP